MAEAMGRQRNVLVIAAFLSLSLTLGTASALIDDADPEATPLSVDIDPQDATLEATATTPDATAKATVDATDDAHGAPQAHVHAHTTPTPDQAETTVDETLTVGEILSPEQVHDTLALIDGLPLDPSEAPSLIGLVVIDEDEALQDRQDAPTGHAVFTEERPEPSTGITPLGIALILTPAAAVAAAGAVHASGGTPWLRRLIVGAPLAPLYSRIARSDVLDHDARERIYSELEATPGLSIREISERLDIARSTTRHHVRILQEADMVDSCRIGRCRIHYVTGDKENAVRGHVLANENRARIQAALQDGEHSIREIADTVDANVGSVHFHLQKLCEVGLAKRRENGRVTYKAADDASGVVFEQPA